jgi:hypothetical protein
MFAVFSGFARCFAQEKNTFESATFGGGCFWGMEKFFKQQV